MTQDSQKSEGPAAPTPAFVWMAVGMLAMLVLLGVVTAALLASQSQQINRQGGMAWLLAGGIFVAVATLVFSACAVCAAVSLLRREPHRTLAIVLLIASLLFLWAFGRPTVRFLQSAFGQNQGAAYRPALPRRPASGAVARVTIPTALLAHFQERGIVLKAARDVVRFDNADVGARCEVVTSFVRFPRGTTVEDKRAYLEAASTPSAINENTDLAMFHPHARGTTSDMKDCEQWPGKSAEIVEKLVDAFTSYEPAPTIPVRVNPLK